MASYFEVFRESLFGVFYIMTEQNNNHSRRVTFSQIRRFVLYIVDAGQVIRAVVLPEFGWDAGAGSFIEKFDFFNSLFDVVAMNKTPKIVSTYITLTFTGLIFRCSESAIFFTCCHAGISGDFEHRNSDAIVSGMISCVSPTNTVKYSKRPRAPPFRKGELPSFGP
jgi:hypothetical protein